MPSVETPPSLIGEKRRERKERALAAARELIAELGYEGVTMRRLARESRVSVPTLYKLFGDKHALLVRAVGTQLARLLSHAGHASSESGVARLMAVPERAGHAILRAPRYSRSVISVFVASGQLQDVTRGVFATLADEFGRALERIRQDGEMLAWVEASTLAERMATQHVMTCVQWASGELPSRCLTPALVFGVCMLTLGGVQGKAHRQLMRRARQVQADARTRHTRVRLESLGG